MSDALTGLQTHAAFPSVELGDAGCRAIAFDVAGLIWVNDQLGFEQGHATLKAVAAALSALVTSVGGRLFRYAGDEFLWILPDDCSRDLCELAELALRATRELKLPYRARDSARSHVALNAALLRLAPGDLTDPPRLRGRVADCIYAGKLRHGTDHDLIACEVR
jgi:GGDEF domain-containing protein